MDGVGRFLGEGLGAVVTDRILTSSGRERSQTRRSGVGKMSRAFCAAIMPTVDEKRGQTTCHASTKCYVFVIRNASQALSAQVLTHPGLT